MSDERFRRLERAAETGDLSARARLFAERVRVGHTPLDRVRLAAYAGDQDARGFLAWKAPAIPPRTKAFLLGLAPFGKEAAVRAAVAAASTLLPLFRALGSTASLDAIESARAWIACPCEEHRRAAATAEDETGWEKNVDPEWILARSAHNAVVAASRLDRTENERLRAARLAAKDAAAAAWNALWFRREPRLVPAATIGACGLEGLDDAFVRAAIERELRAFALAERR